MIPPVDKEEGKREVEPERRQVHREDRRRQSSHSLKALSVGVEVIGSERRTNERVLPRQPLHVRCGERYPLKEWNVPRRIYAIQSMCKRLIGGIITTPRGIPGTIIRVLKSGEVGPDHNARRIRQWSASLAHCREPDLLAECCACRSDGGIERIL
jgi:hypothetical protein